MFATAVLGLSFGLLGPGTPPVRAAAFLGIASAAYDSMRTIMPQAPRARSERPWTLATAVIPDLPDKGPRHADNVSLRAVLAQGHAPLAEGLSWRILKLGTTPQDKELVWSGGGAEPQMRLPPGRYFVEASWGLATQGQELDVAADSMAAPTIALNAGTLLVNAAAVAGGPPLEDMFFVLRRAGTGQGAEAPAEIGRSSLTQAVFHAPAGQYSLIAKHGLSSVELPVTIAAGQENRLEAVLNSGTLALTARAKPGSPLLSGATFLVFEAGETGSRREILRSNLDEPKFSLPAGRYRVAAVLGMARVEQEISVAPAETKTEDLVLNAGGVRLASLMAGNNMPIDQNLLYRVYSLNGPDGAANQELLTSTLPTPTLFLPSGRYRIESQYGWHNARQTREIDVSAADVLDVSFEHKASEVKLRLVPGPGGDVMERVKWTLKYNGGGTVLISQDAAPTLILQAGHYQAMAQHEAKTYTQTFEAASNQEQIIELIAQ